MVQDICGASGREHMTGSGATHDHPNACTPRTRRLLSRLAVLSHLEGRDGNDLVIPLTQVLRAPSEPTPASHATAKHKWSVGVHVLTEEILSRELAVRVVHSRSHPRERVGHMFIWV